MFIPDGAHTLALTAYDSSDKSLGSTSEPITITGQTKPAVFSKLQSSSDWQSCLQELAGSECAGGLGVATASQTLNQSSPSLSGSSTLFSLGGSEVYSNALWWLSIGGGTLLTTYTYTLDFYIDNGNAPEALEFDVNQSYGGVRYTFGTECSFKNTKKWDVWNPASEVWVPTSASCLPFTSKKWHHLEWQFDRVSNQVHYISITIDGKVMPINLTFNPQPNWNQEGINIAFQMDGDYKQTPYNVWLDNVTLTLSY